MNPLPCRCVHAGSLAWHDRSVLRVVLVPNVLTCFPVADADYGRHPAALELVGDRTRPTSVDPIGAGVLECETSCQAEL